MKKNFKLILAITFLILVLGGISFFILGQGLPDPKNFQERKIAQSTKIYDRTGKILLYEIHGEQKRTVINLDQISPYIIKTTIAAEDHNFYQHHGFVFSSIIRAITNNLFHPTNLQGASTITQQLARSTFLTTQKTIIRKIKEAILTFQIERHYTKNQILEMYFNQISFGDSNYGIEAASGFYFNKTAKDLNLSEAAYLTSLLQSPSYLSPYGSHLEQLEQRKNWVLSRTEILNYFPKNEVEKAKQEKVVFATQSFGFKAPHFVMYVRGLLYDQFSQEDLEQGGYVITTTLDMNLQNIAEKTVTKYGDYNEKNIGAKNLALLAEDPQTGQILAMVGSRDYWNMEAEGNVNATLSIRQPGSSFKPIVYATAFKKGFLPESTIFDTALDGITANFSTDPNNPYLVTNYDSITRGPVTFRQALSQSLNIPAVKVLYLAGIQNVIQTAKDFSISTLTEPPEHYGLSLVLGGGGIKLIEMVHAYTVFSQEGILHPQTAILKIENSQGNVLRNFSLQNNQIISSQIARQINSILSDNISRAPTFGFDNKLYFPNFDVAAKTGTDSQYRDAWTLGYTTNLAAGVWAGNNDRTPVAPSGAPGAMVAAPCWHEFMEKAFEFYLPGQFTKPLPYNVSQIPKPMVNGQYLINREYKNINTEEIKTIKEIHNILYYIDKNNILGPDPINPNNDPQFQIWELPVLLWAQQNIPNFNQEYNINPEPGYIPIDITGDQIITFPDAPNITPLYPKNGDFLNNNLRLDVIITSSLEIKKTVLYLNQELLGDLEKGNDNHYYYSLPSDKIKDQNEIKIEATDISDQINSLTEIVFR
ncbi:MAG: transglycosylase domain-containing protein [Candidatus Paceibacterota bacterium]|jgi:penicillin-binding protein 1C